MTDRLITEQPLWFILFCLLAGLVYAFILYRKDKKLDDAPLFVKRLMAGFRFLAVSLIAFLLLSPLIKKLSKTIQEPIIVLAQDNSESLAEYQKGDYLDAFRKLEDKLSVQFEVRTFSFGNRFTDTTDIDFSDKQTDIAEPINESLNKFYNRNIGALVLASDGIFNRGNNPAYLTDKLNFPVYTVALGDTTVKQDAAIIGVNNNKIAFLNNEFPVQVLISAKKMKGKSAKLSISGKGKVLHSEIINYQSDDFFTKKNFILKADKVGVQSLQVKLSYLDDEHSKINNRKEVIIEVIDSKQEILLSSHAPHPDIGALRRALETNANFDTEYMPVSKLNTSQVSDYDLIIMYQLPAKGNSAASVFKQINRHSIPVLYVVGRQTNVSEFNRLNKALIIRQVSGSYDPVQGHFNPAFALFELNPNIKSLYKDAPPLFVPYGETILKSGTEVLAYQRVKSIETEKPLIVIHTGENTGSAKSAVIAGEGIWQWALQDYRANKNHSLFNEMINKTVQYLSLKADKERFRVNTEKIVSENQAIKFRAEVYNKSYEPVNEGIVKLQLTDSAGTKYDYEFSRTGRAYDLDIGSFEPGRYQWRAETEIDGKTESKNGIINVAEINIEAENITANHAVLNKLAAKTGGKLFYEDGLNALYDSIVNNPNIKPVSYSEKKTESLMNSKWLFFLILILLSAEWFLRKFYGTV